MQNDVAQSRLHPDVEAIRTQIQNVHAGFEHSCRTFLETKSEMIEVWDRHSRSAATNVRCAPPPPGTAEADIEQLAL